MTDLTVAGGARAAYCALAHVQKSGAGVSPYMRVINRKFGRLIAAAVAQSRATPHHLTAASLVAFLAGAGLLVGVRPGLPMAIGASLLLQLGFAFDSADGQLARLRGVGSPAGEWLDHVVDSGRHLMLHLAVLIGLYQFTDVAGAVLLVPLGFAVVSTVRFFAQILAEQLLRRDPIAGPARMPRFGGWIQAPADSGLLNLVILLWPATTVFMWVYGVMAGFNALLLAATLLRRHRELAEPPPAS